MRDEVAAANGDGCETALYLRYDLAEILASTGLIGEAQSAPTTLYEDLCLIYGPIDEFAIRVAEFLRELTD
ncbi:hypothetical protein D5S18_16140 [Nocardia panacis]|uniref:Uncharacterized protein n=1 Tax=Nocardia panacis TaxID=2340916 RepID=A0A3A4KG54_9NOCA|nr:hypothetical protein D5S18_16140 [Nocardia panacis]